jgi:hypothetical protein
MAEGDLTADADCALPDRRSNDLTVVSVVLQQMTLLEARLVRKLDDNAKASLGRWQTHDEEHEEMGAAIRAISAKLDAHLDAEAREELVFNARIQPVKGAFAMLRREWRTIVIVGMVGLDMVGQITQAMGLRP